MNRQRRITASEAMYTITDAADTDSDGENAGDLSNDETSDCTESEISDSDTPESEESDLMNEESEEAVEEFCSRNGCKWQIIHNWSAAGRLPGENIFRSNPGTKFFAKQRIDSKFASWNLLVRNSMLEEILRNSNKKLSALYPEGKIVTNDELLAFIGLIYFRGAFGWRKMRVSEMWSKEFGPAIFRETMSRFRFQQIMRCLRFDDIDSRRARVNQDLFAPIRNIYEAFVSACIQVYVPNVNLTLDEQLLPSKNRCKFIQFMPAKPDKYGIKFFVLVDNITKFCYNSIPYLGTQGTEDRGNLPFGEYIVKKLLNVEIQKKGYNITTDNYFTTAPLANYLLEKGTTLVGTVRQTSKSLIPQMKVTKPHFDTTFFKSDKILCASYQAKINKKVILISTMHKTPIIDYNTEKKKPEMIQYYNQTKSGVDVMDNMLRLYSTKSTSRRWPMCVFLTFWTKLP